MKMKKPICEYCKGEINVIYTSNHIIGCNLESIAQILRWRGFEKEAEQLDNIASKIK